MYSKSKTHGIITEELAELCKQVWSGQYKSVAARDFRSAIGQEYKIFASYDQQDAHEFMVILIDIMHLELQIPMEIVRQNFDNSTVTFTIIIYFNFNFVADRK